ncbi:hypothetical protein HNR23_003023 [Nocardiopsis mwathae]|uniref:Nucleotidyltransferase family protein n=1 Tax=Nocardiopsis mwathae TaxID=1472723 RepID=A0A7W9YIW8_9ACTN|nr:hypothetical protein [Nocardiopsis mwathae]
MTEQITIHQHPLFIALEELDLPRQDFIIAGSGPLLAHGIRDNITDLDIVARGPAWELVQTMAPIQPAPWEDVARVLLFDGRLEILNGWFPSMWAVDEFIDDREIRHGLPFAPLDRVLRWKSRLGRAKDLADIDATLRYFTAAALPPGG